MHTKPNTSSVPFLCTKKLAISQKVYMYISVTLYTQACVSVYWVCVYVYSGLCLCILRATKKAYIMLWVL